MIRSMTAFGNARVDLEQGSLSLELRSVNSRFLDLYFRLPDELRHTETPLRELLTSQLARGKVEVRVSFTRNASAEVTQLDPEWLGRLAEQLEAARRVLPEVGAPRLVELFNWPGQRGNDALDPQIWGAACLSAGQQALSQLQEGRKREGERLAAMMRECAEGVGGIVDLVEAHLPQLLAEHREKLATKLRESLEAAFPGGFAHISGAELSERVAQEAGLFALRIDVAEELSRLRSHLDELRHLLTEGGGKPGGKAQSKGSAGKRLDFLFQEMNREANTLGSKAGSLEVTRAAMDLKLLIEQMREQAQNLE
ncbi:YicC/YloC family endoribonuclease [Bordetella avium]|uniref:YicC/YloC family endoribonuclease n=1 Tax=Bordetella avium TaxID=521 RepID=UPI000E0B34CA|nr:YicC/YloC family endoribonuclease [Bordetella avium]AZY49275.1 YicC family protein [Bordetella avium]RIQ12754.1 YicC family protein [Bordetella avium]RIQ19207.1 YicC family protein [Bordetella avium]RIQ33374.1 YicC family protein [Bordetella avium]RIQ37929.1 YicC family protein [Bordetella avium]